MNLTILTREFDYKTSRSSGPGGQHVNKTNTRVEVHWNVYESASIDAFEKELLTNRIGKRITNEGELIVTDESTRSQLDNKKLAEEKMILLITNNLKRKKKRKATKPSKKSIEKRLNSKKKRAEIKQNRQLRL